MCSNTNKTSEPCKTVRTPSYNRQPPALQPLQASQRALKRSGLLSPTTAAERPPPALACSPWATIRTKNNNPQTPLPLGRHHQQLSSDGQETSSENPPAGKRAGGSVTAQRAPLRRPAGPGTTACKVTGTPSNTTTPELQPLLPTAHNEAQRTHRDISPPPPPPPT